MHKRYNISVKKKKTINRKDKQYTMLQLELSLLTIINIAVYTE